MKVLSIGEVLWDVFGEAEYLGGAPLNFSVALQRLGNTAALLSAVGTDERGERTRQAMHRLGVSAEFIQTTDANCTGVAIVSSDSAANPVFTIVRPAAFDCLEGGEELLEHIAQWAPDWLYFGTLAPANAATEELLVRLIESLPDARRFYDVNLRPGHWNLALVEKLSSLSHVQKLNQAEAALLDELSTGRSSFSLERFCAEWSARHGIATLCITLGSQGCAIYSEDRLRVFPAQAVKVIDTVGAGDAFAAAFLHGLSLQWPLEKTATLANALGAVVASRAGATPDWTLDDCRNLVARNNPAQTPPDFRSSSVTGRNSA